MKGLKMNRLLRKNKLIRSVSEGKIWNGNKTQEEIVEIAKKKIMILARENAPIVDEVNDVKKILKET